jgi:hypothetical protein
MGMDVTPIILGIAAINLGVFLAGCALAAFRTWREAHPVGRRKTARRAVARVRADHRSQPLGRPTH